MLMQLTERTQKNPIGRKNMTSSILNAPIDSIICHGTTASLLDARTAFSRFNHSAMQWVRPLHFQWTWTLRVCVCLNIKLWYLHLPYSRPPCAVCTAHTIRMRYFCTFEYDRNKTDTHSVRNRKMRQFLASTAIYLLYLLPNGARKENGKKWNIWYVFQLSLRLSHDVSVEFTTDFCLNELEIAFNGFYQFSGTHR